MFIVIGYCKYISADQILLLEMAVEFSRDLTILRVLRKEDMTMWQLKPESCQDANFAVNGDTGDCQNDDQRRHQWRQRWQVGQLISGMIISTTIYPGAWPGLDQFDWRYIKRSNSYLIETLLQFSSWPKLPNKPVHHEFITTDAIACENLSITWWKNINPSRFNLNNHQYNEHGESRSVSLSKTGAKWTPWTGIELQRQFS